MQVVADHLVAKAGSVSKSSERNLFARSAFNRYYYATFLTIRSTLAEIDPRWDEPTHASVPEILRETVVERFNRRVKKMHVNRNEAEQTKARGCTAAKALADLLETGNEIRKIADYEPEQLVEFKNETAYLNGITSGSARQWCIDAQTRCRVLLNAAKQLGLC
jgi:hypothetical protein